MNEIIERRFALLIAADDYVDPDLEPLIAPQLDVADLAHVLADPSIGNFAVVQPLINPKLQDVRLAISRFFRDRDRNDLFLIYFSGHGVIDPDDGNFYLAFHDTEVADPSVAGLPASFITRQMDKRKLQRVVLILDCCYSGRFAGTKAETDLDLDAIFNTGYGRVVLTASRTSEHAWDGNILRDDSGVLIPHSLFTHYLIEGLRSGLGGTYLEPYISIDALYTYAHKQVETMAKPRPQTPNKFVPKQEGAPLIIARNVLNMARTIPTDIRLIDLLFTNQDSKKRPRVNIDDISVIQNWKTRPSEKWSILLGCKQNHECVWLNLVADGSHGMIAGTTGAGKSVLMQSIILSLCLTHSPDEINLVLIDFKNSGMAQTFSALPHTIGVFTQLQERSVKRFMKSLKLEAQRRQEILKQVGMKDIDAYHERQHEEDLSPLPRLVVLIDEFAEVGMVIPAFWNEVSSILAISRSVGIHLILATQKPSAVVASEVWTHINFRICLKVANVMDSWDMIGIPDAESISSKTPGRGFVNVGSDRLELFQSANVIYPYQTERDIQTAKYAVANNSVFDIKLIQRGPQKTSRTAVRNRELSVLVEKVIEAGHSRPRWPEPLPERLSLAYIWRHFDVSKPMWQWDRDQQPFLARPRSVDQHIQLAIGIIDDLPNLTRRPLYLDLANRHYLIVGAPRSGCTTLLQTVVYTLILNTTPEEAHVSILDFGGQRLFPLKSAPHVANVLSANEPERLRRFFLQVEEEIEQRQDLKGRPNRDPGVFYIVDGYDELNDLLPDQVSVLTRVARDGLSLNMHLIVTVDHPKSIPMDMRDYMLGRLALPWGDRREYFDVSLRTPLTSPEVIPGRGLVQETPKSPPLEFQVGLPIAKPFLPQSDSFDMPTLATVSDDSIASFLAQASSELDKAWSGAKPDTVKVLPVSVPAAEFMQLRQEAESHTREVEAFPKLVIGLGERFLDWAYVDYALHSPHFLIAGPVQSGKTNLLRVWAWRLAERYSPAQVQLSLIGLKQRSLDDLHQLPHVKYSANNEFALDPLLEALVDEAEQRHQKLGALYKDNPTLEPSAISEGMGAAHFVLVDDFDPIHFTRDRQSRLLKFAHYGQDTKTFLVIAGVSRDLLDFGELLSRLKRGRSIVMLQPGDLEVRAVDVQLSSFYLRQEHPVGRGVRLLGNRPEFVQTLHLDSEYLIDRLDTLSSDKSDKEISIPIPEPMTIVEQPNLPDMRASITRSDDSIASFLAPASSELDKAWSGAKPDTVKVLPVSVPAAEFMQLRQEAESHIREVEAFPKLVIGLGERFLDWAYVDYALHGPHFLIAGPARSGKTNLLRVWAWRLAERYSPAQVQLSLIGLKQRSLDDLHQLPHVKYSANNEFALDPLLEALVDEAEQRHQKLGALYKDNPTLEPSAISEGVGAAHFVLVDDFDPTHFTRDRQSRLLEFAHYGQDTKTFLVIASVSRNLLDYSELLSRLERGRSIVLLQPGDLEVRVIDVRLSSFYLRQEHPVGRGVLLLGNRPELVQTLHLDSEYLARRSENFKSHMDGMSESNLAVGGDQYPQVDSS